MKSKKRIWVISLALIGLILISYSCEEDNVEPSLKHKYYLSEIYEHNHLNYKIFYNDDLSISEILYYTFSHITDTIELDWTYIFEYDESKFLTKMSHFYEDQEYPQVEVLLIYNNSNLVEKVVLNESNYYEIEYNSKNQRISYTQYISGQYSEKTEYEYNSKDNVTKQTLYDPYIPYVSWIKSEFKYDDKYRPYHFMNEDIAYLLFTNMPETRNNITKRSFEEDNGRTGETSITYIYNSEGFPIEEYGSGYYNDYIYIITE